MDLDFETGKVFDRDDYEEFRKVLEEDGYNVSPADFDYYFDCIDGYRADDMY